MQSSNPAERVRTISAICQAAAAISPTDPSYHQMVALFAQLETLLLRPLGNTPSQQIGSSLSTVTTLALSVNQNATTSNPQQLELMHMGGWAHDSGAYGNGTSYASNPSASNYDTSTPDYDASSPSYGASGYYNYHPGYGP